MYCIGGVFGALTVFVFWMCGGEEEALDYSSMGYELGPSDSEVNGYTYLREFTEAHTAEFPEDYWFEVDYSRRVNWDRELFQTILDSNQAFLDGFEQAFDRPQFVNDQAPTPEAISPSVGQFRDYVNLRILEIRVLQMDDLDAQALRRLLDLKGELERFDHAGAGALIGWLTSIAMIGVFEADLGEFIAEAELPFDLWSEAAQGYTLYRNYPRAMQQAYRMEFLFCQHCMSDLIRSPGVASDFSMIIEPNFRQRVFTWVAVKVGLKPNRTNNTVFLTYKELIEEATKPLIDRQFPYAAATEERLSDRSFMRFANRNPTGEVLLEFLYPAYERLVEMGTMRDVSSRAMQIRLALHAYYLDQEQLPGELQALVPEFLPEVPSDPFDGKPMRYSRERRIVYSVGNDFIDKGGSELPFIFTVSDDDSDGYAEHDRTEPTYPLRGF